MEKSDYTARIMKRDFKRNSVRLAVQASLAMMVAGFSVSAYADARESSESSNAQRESHQRRLFADVDRDHDGKLTRQEFVAVIISRLFQDFDKNKNGKITKAEFFEYARDKKLAEKEYPLMDTEAKGYITQKDVDRNQPLILRLQGEFKKLDKGNKGYITLADLPDLTPGS